MKTRHHIILVVYDGFELLDMAGPASVFRMATEYAGKSAYRITVASAAGGAIQSSCGVSVETQPYLSLTIDATTSVFTVGGTDEGLFSAMQDEGLLLFLRQVAQLAGRYGSICSGTFLLAAAGLLDGKKVSTHWRRAEQLQRQYPNILVCADQLYVRDGRVWSSAGIASGVDMALAIVEDDFGRSIMLKSAKRLVVYAHRPGSQRQFSAILQAQSHAVEPFAKVLAWVSENLGQDVGVSDMAEYAGMSERSFYRKFKTEVGMSPAKFLETLRLDAARQLLEAGAPIKVIPSEVGYASESGFRSAFEAKFKISPSQYKLMHT